MTEAALPPGPSETLVVVGAGTMGSGIALSALLHGFRVELVDPQERMRTSALEAITRRTERAVGASAAGVLSSLRLHEELARVAGRADVVIEAVPELAEIKHAVFASLATSAPPHALLASNTSTMSISELAEAAGGSDRVIGLHFFNPVHRMELVEIVVGRATSDATRDDAVALVGRLGKDPILVKDVPGFVTSRLGLVLGNEAMRIVGEGTASAADVDKAMRLGYNHPMGPLELADLVGLDARLNNLRSVAAQTGRPEFEPPAMLVELVEAGRLGRKSGGGFYDYDDEGARVPSGARSR